MRNESKQQLVIQAGSPLSGYWSELWSYRELFYFLAWRDLLVRYKQTAVGVAWTLVRPLLTMVVFTAVFGKIAKLPSGGVPYPLLVYAAMLPWQFFANSMSDSSMSIVGNANLVAKIYFPRLIIPASTVIVGLVDFIISFAVLGALMVWYHFLPDWRLITLPFFVLLAFGASFGLGLWIAALNVKYRDFRYIVPFIIQLGLYVSPVGFSSSIIPDGWRFLYSVNPMVGVIDGFRWAIIGEAAIVYWPGLLLSVAVVMLLLVTGFRFFRKVERTFADNI
jgi:lipopolysaccharide transport system permease protein